LKAKKLTPKKLHFARCVASGMSQSGAYREAFTVRPLTTAESVHQQASRLMADSNVASRVNQLIAAREKAVAATAVSDRERVVVALRRWMEEAEPSDTNKLKAAHLLGQSAGLFQTEINLNDQRRDSEGLASEIEALLLTANESTEVEQETPEQLH
jgi:hypothetical protein